MSENIDNKNYKLAFMNIPLWKLFILQLLSNGFYIIFWFYKQWQVARIVEQQNDMQNIDKKPMPILEALFFMLSSFWLFAKFDSFYSSCTEITQKIKVFSFKYIFASIFLISYCLGKLVRCVENKQFAHYGESTDIWVLFSLIELVIIMVIQHKINQINKQHSLQAEQNNWSWKSTIFLIICILYQFICMVYMTFLTQLKQVY